MTTEYVVTYVRAEGEHALTLAVALGNDEQARQFASRTAQRCHGVTLSAVDDDGAVASMARWLDGVLSRNGNSPAIIEGEVEDETEDEVSADEAIADEHDDEAHHFEGRCMKCKVNRAYIGRVTELSNGSRAAKGSCPVCGTTITRMVARTTPLDDEWDNADTEADDADNPTDAPEASAEVDSDSDTESEIAEAISDVTEGEPIAEVAEATASLAAEFSNAAAEVEQPKPAKKAVAKKAAPAKKAVANKGSDGRTPNQRGAASPTKGHCPKCDSDDVDVIERAGIRIFTVHPDPKRNLDRCPGSTTVVQDGH